MKSETLPWYLQFLVCSQGDQHIHVHFPSYMCRDSWTDTYEKHTGKNVHEEVLETLKNIPKIIRISESSDVFIAIKVHASSQDEIMETIENVLFKRSKKEWLKYRIASLQFLCTQIILKRTLHKFNHTIISSILRLSGVDKDKRDGIVQTLQRLDIVSE